MMDRVFDAERAEQDYSNSDAFSDADTDFPPDYEELEYEGSGADGEAAEDRRPLIFVPKGFFSDDVSIGVMDVPFVSDDGMILLDLA